MMAFVVPRVAKSLGDEDRSWLWLRTVVNFSTAAAVAVGVLIITGSYLSFLHVGSWTALIGTTYGRTLLLKLALVGVAMLMGGYNLIVIKPQLDRAIEQPESGPRIQKRFRRTLVVHDGRLEPLPDAFQLLAPARLTPFLLSPILSWRGKLGALWDLVAPRGGPPPGGDESLASFVRRRLGQEVLERIAQPMVGGIYTADPETLSLATTMPRFLELERRHRSLILGLMRQGRARETGTSGARFGLFATLRRGLSSLVDAIAERLPAGSVRIGARAVAIERLGAAGDGSARAPGARWRIALAGGERLEASGVIVALPAPRAAELLAGVDRELASDLGAIAYASSAIVSMAFRRVDVPRALDAFGVVVPEIERRRIIACSFSSVKYSGRAPADAVLLRAFVGGALHPELFALDDRALVAAVRDELRSLLGIEVEPTFSRLHRWAESMPQYCVGHAGRIERIRARAAALETLALAGNAYDGVGLPDCIRSGEGAADALLDRLGALAGRSEARAGNER